MKPRSITFRLTLWYASAISAALALFGGLLWFSLRHELTADIEDNLNARARQFEDYTIREAAEVPRPQLSDEMEEFCDALPRRDYLRVEAEDGFSFLCPAGASPPARAGVVDRTFTAGGRKFHLDARASLEGVIHTLVLVRILLLSLAPMAIVIACAGGYWLSRRALKPVDEITRAAGAIGIHNLSQRLPPPSTGDEIERLAKVWNSMLARLENAVGVLSQFAADASHELRTPLAVIRTTAEIALRRARTPESYRQSLMEIAAEASRMTALVEDLLFLARNEAQAAEMPKEPLELKALLDDAASELSAIAEMKRIRFVHEPANGAVVPGNRPALRRLFVILLDNAIKYSHPDSQVIIGVAKGPGRVSVSIEDFGIGIPPNDRPRIFDRFYQADKARRDGGFGLGLSLADSIARSHGAAIDVQSREGAGSRFRVVFGRTGREDRIRHDVVQPGPTPPGK